MYHCLPLDEANAAVVPVNTVVPAIDTVYVSVGEFADVPKSPNRNIPMADPTRSRFAGIVKLPLTVAPVRIEVGVVVFVTAVPDPVIEKIGVRDAPHAGFAPAPPD